MEEKLLPTGHGHTNCDIHNRKLYRAVLRNQTQSFYRTQGLLQPCLQGDMCVPACVATTHDRSHLHIPQQVQAEGHVVLCTLEFPAAGSTELCPLFQLHRPRGEHGAKNSNEPDTERQDPIPMWSMRKLISEKQRGERALLEAGEREDQNIWGGKDRKKLASRCKTWAARRSRCQNFISPYGHRVTVVNNDALGLQLWLSGVSLHV